MANTYRKANRCWDCTTTGTLWTNTLGGVPSNTIGPKYVTRVVYIPDTAGDDLVFQDVVSSEQAITLKAGAADVSPITVDFSAENGGKGRRFHSLKISTHDGGTAYIYIA